MKYNYLNLLTFYILFLVSACTAISEIPPLRRTNTVKERLLRIAKRQVTQMPPGIIQRRRTLMLQQNSLLTTLIPSSRRPTTARHSTRRFTTKRPGTTRQPTTRRVSQSPITSMIIRTVKLTPTARAKTVNPAAVTTKHIGDIFELFTPPQHAHPIQPVKPELHKHPKIVCGPTPLPVQNGPDPIAPSMLPCKPVTIPDPVPPKDPVMLPPLDIPCCQDCNGPDCCCGCSNCSPPQSCQTCNNCTNCAPSVNIPWTDWKCTSCNSCNCSPTTCATNCQQNTPCTTPCTTPTNPPCTVPCTTPTNTPCTIPCTTPCTSCQNCQRFCKCQHISRQNSTEFDPNNNKKITVSCGLPPPLVPLPEHPQMPDIPSMPQFRNV